MVSSFLLKAAAFCRISWIESSRTAHGSKGEAPLPGLRLSQTDPSLVNYRIAANSLSEDGQGVQRCHLVSDCALRSARGSRTALHPERKIASTRLTGDLQTGKVPAH